MDAYAPIAQSSVPALYTDAGDGWSSPPITSTIVYIQHQVSRGVRAAGSTSFGASAGTFVVLQLPVLDGLDRLRRFQNFEDNWDSEGGRRPDAEALEAASKVFGLVSTYNVPQVALNASGQPMLIFDGKICGEIVVTSKNTLDYFFMNDEAIFAEDIEFDGQLSRELIEYIQP